METKIKALTREASVIIERVARIVSSVRGINPDYAQLAAELDPAIPFDLFGIVLLRNDRQAVRVTICEREGDTWKSHYRQHPLEGSKLEQVLDNPILTVQNYPNGVDDLPAVSGDAISGSPYLRSTLIAPLIVGEHVLGALELGSTIPNAYSNETLLRLIDSIVRVLASTIERNQLGGSVEIQDRQREALKHVSRALTREMNLPGILLHIVVGIGEALHVSSAIITLDARRGKLHLEAEYGLDAQILTTVIEQTAALTEHSILGATLRRRQPCVSQDIGVDERYPESGLFTRALGIRSIFSYPLVTGDKVYGALLLCSSEPGGFTPLKADILSLFASQATIAIHNGMLLEAARKRQHFQEAIEQLEQAHIETGELASTNVQALFDRVCRETEQTFGVRFSSLLRFLSDHLLTQSERDLQTIVYAARESDMPDPEGTPSLLPEAVDAREESTALLMQTAEAALKRAGLFGHVGAALALSQPHLYEQIAHDTTDAWFLMDLDGHCLYMNATAEVLCGMRLDNAAVTIEEVFASILYRVRNAHELRSYLRNFIHVGKGKTQQDQQSNDHSSEQFITNTVYEYPSLSMIEANFTLEKLQCVVAAEPVGWSENNIRDGGHPFNIEFDELSGNFIRTNDSTRPQSETQQEPYLSERDNAAPAFAPSDHHYQFTRIPLYDKEDRLVAQALQVHDITDQVRDEKNKSMLLSSVSHDLRTPLTTIKAAVTGLLHPDIEWDEQTRREMLEEIDTEADRLSVLVTALIDMSRIEMGALILEKEWCDIIELIHGTLSRLDRVLAGHKVRTRFAPQLPLIRADYAQLERVFRNLLENAVRHSPEESDILLILEVENGMLRVQVIDQGSGVPEEERERIFKTFYSLDVQGNGLGLAICQGIIEAHGGRIWVEPAPQASFSNGDEDQHGQRGSCFVFVLPLHS